MRPAVDRDVDALQRVRAAHRPVAAGGEPGARRGPGRRTGTASALRSGPRNGMVSSSICVSCAAHSGCMFAATPSVGEARPTSSGWTTWRCAMWCRRSAAPLAVARRLEGVQRLAHRPVADRVHVHLEAGGVEPRDVPPGARSGSTKDRPVVVRSRPPQRSRYGVDHRGGEVLGDAVLHDLDRRRHEPGCALVDRAPLDELLDLLEPALAVPPQRAARPGRSAPGAAAPEVRRRRVAHARRSRRGSRPARR